MPLGYGVLCLRKWCSDGDNQGPAVQAVVDGFHIEAAMLCQVIANSLTHCHDEEVVAVLAEEALVLPVGEQGDGAALPGYHVGNIHGHGELECVPELHVTVQTLLACALESSLVGLLDALVQVDDGSGGSLLQQSGIDLYLLCGGVGVDLYLLCGGVDGDFVDLLLHDRFLLLVLLVEGVCVVVVVVGVGGVGLGSVCLFLNRSYPAEEVLQNIGECSEESEQFVHEVFLHRKTLLSFCTMISKRIDAGYMVAHHAV